MTEQRNAQEKLEALRVKRFKERGERLKEERKRLALSLAEFASLLGIHRNTQGNYEAGREPPTSYLLAAQQAGIDIAYVIDGARMTGFASQCVSTVESIFTRALMQGLCDLNPAALGQLAFLIAQNASHEAGALNGAMEGVQINALIDAAFRTPEEFDESVTAIAKYRRLRVDEEPTPREEATMILETLAIFADGMKRGAVFSHAPTLRDGIRTVAEIVARRRVSANETTE